MTTPSNLGFPRIGKKRELKHALEKFWKGETTEQTLQTAAAQLRQTHWQTQKAAGIEIIPSNDFSLYDQMLDASVMLSAIPDRFGWQGGEVPLSLYFDMARGGKASQAMEMTKWFDTNYHYLVPELSKKTAFRANPAKALQEFREAKALGITTRPVLIGPVSYLILSKMQDGSERWNLLPSLLKAYQAIIQALATEGAEWIQMDEPCLVLDLDADAKEACRRAYESLKDAGARLMLATYFGALRDNLALACSLPVSALHADLARGKDQLEEVCRALPKGRALSLGVIDGRNIWKTDLARALSSLRRARDLRGEDSLLIAPSCSLLHVPVDLASETVLDEALSDWMAFAAQKLEEIRLLAQAMRGEMDEAAFAANRSSLERRRSSKRIHNEDVQKALRGVSAEMTRRRSSFKDRQSMQAKSLNLPLLPTTTIGSYPQTAEIRRARASWKRGEMSREDYERFLEKETKAAMDWQDKIGLDVPVHGEFERNDMVEYFGEKLEGFAFTKHGWVQSYGSRCVKPPVIYGDVRRGSPMTVRWSRFAQDQTEKPVKGMLTGPVTILQWSFVRDDQSEEATCRQIALAIRDEVLDLEEAGIRIIQIDEAALREGLPLRRSDWGDYLSWAVECFRLSACGVRDETQIHTHMCYSEFNDIIPSVAAMDADVISIESSRSKMELLEAFVDFRYPNDIGPGVYDIHSPRVPSQGEMEGLLGLALRVLRADQLWVNPDCGLKTRSWSEARPSIEAMVMAARSVREGLEDSR